MARLSLSLLGGFQATVNGEVVTAFESNKVRALLAYLAVEAHSEGTRHGARPHERSTLAGLLWPDHPEAAARTNLRHVLRQLRQTLPAVDPDRPFLLTSSRMLQFNLHSDHTLDVARFTSLLAACDGCDHPALAGCSGCIARYTEAAALYKGAFLAGFSLFDSDLFEGWLTVERERLQRQALDLFSTLATLHEELGDTEQASHYAWRQLELEPWREEAHRQLMRLLARSGQRSAALAQYERCRTILATELGVEPDPQTTALYEQIRSEGWGDGDATPSPPHSPTPLLPSPPTPLLLHSPIPHYDWGEAPATTAFYGRQGELAQLEQWLLGQQCRLIVILGMGGMGKTTLALRSAKTLATHFDFLFWRSLLNAPTPAEWLRDALHFLSQRQAATLPASYAEQVTELLSYLRQHRCLFVLDNVESVLEAGRVGDYRPGYQGYSQLFERIAQSEHRSTVILTSRERPRGIERMEEDFPWVRTLSLAGLEAEAGQALLRMRGVAEQVDLVSAVVQRYSGNPLALKLVAQTINDLFDGDVAAFLGDELPTFDDIRIVLDQQFNRLTPLEREILVWLAVEREAVSMQQLMQSIMVTPTRREIVEALRSLQRRSLLEKSDTGLILQNVVMEYVTEFVIEQVCSELESGQVGLFDHHALLRAQAREYVRQSQVRLLLAPIGKQLLARHGRAWLAKQLHQLVATLRARGALIPGYAAGNLINLLLHLEVDLRGYDFSRLAVWQAALRGKTLIDVNFSGADLTGSTFSDTFGVVRTVTFSSDSRKLAAGTSDGEIRLWHAADQQPIGVLKAHSRPVNAVIFSPDSALFASCGDDFTVRLWETESNRVVHTLAGHLGWVRSLAFSPDGQTLVSASHDRSLRLWNVATGAIRCVIDNQDAPVHCVAFHPNGDLIASGGDDHAVRLWDAHTGVLLATHAGHQGQVVAVAFSPDGRTLASSGTDHTIRLWDVGTETHQLLAGHEGEVRCLAFSPDGQTLASGSADYTLRLWDVRDAGPSQIRHTLHGHSRGVNSLAFDPRGETLVSGSDDHTICLWNAHTGQLRDTLFGHTDWVRTLAFCPRQTGEGELLASGSDDGLVRLWEVGPREEAATETSRLRRTLTGHHHWIWSMAFSPDGTVLASGGADHLLHLWNPEAGQYRHRAYEHGDTVRALAFSPQGLLATGCADTMVRLWEPQTGQLLATLAGHTGWVQSLAFSPHLAGRCALLATTGNDRTVCLWEVSHEPPYGRLIASLRGHTNTVLSVLFSPDGRLIASAGEDRTIRLWDAQAGEPLRLLLGHEKEVNAIAFSPGSLLLASASTDQTARLWEVASGRQRHLLSGHSAWIRTVAFRPDGKTLATGSADQTIRLWQVETGEMRHILRGHNHWVWTISFSPTGATLASGSVDGTVMVWDPDSGSCRLTLRPPGPYHGMKITGVTGISAAQKAALVALGAVDEAE